MTIYEANPTAFVTPQRFIELLDACGLSDSQIERSICENAPTAVAALMAYEHLRNIRDGSRD